MWGTYVIHVLQYSSLHYTPYSARMSLENTHKLMRFYVEGLILGAIL